MARTLLACLLLTCSSLLISQESSSPPIEVPSNSMVCAKVAPVYPPLARQARIQGTVVLKAIIGKEGSVENLQLISGHPMLAPAAIEAVRQWKYQPYRIDGRAVEVATEVRVNFELANDPATEGGLVSNARLGECQGCVRTTEMIMRGLRIQKVDPIYPPQAISAHVAGSVSLDVHIDQAGLVQQVTLITGHPMLAPAAIEAVRQWRYRPFELNGKPRDVQIQVWLNFQFSPNNPSETLITEGMPPQGMALPPQRVRVSSGVEQGLLVSKISPEYPPDAREQHIQGQVVLKALIGKEGAVENLELISGDPALATASIDAVRQWRYRPYLLNGQPVVVETQIVVNFTLQD